jgi:DNA polymerase-4
MVARICCLDLDTFFVSVERLFDPTLEGKPVVVGGLRGARGVVTACSYEVRAYGVRSGMSLRDASQLAPRDAIFLPPRHGVYGTYSEKVRAVLDRYTPDVRAASIDEFYLDFSGCEGLYRKSNHEDGDIAIERAVRAMCSSIRKETGLPASAGIGASRIIAKVASGRAKPEGVLLVPQGTEREFLSPLPARKLPGIGPKAEQRLLAEGIQSLGDLVNLPPGPQRARYARILGMLESVFAGGSHQDPFGRERPAFLEHDPEHLSAGSLSNERTFFDSLRDEAAVHRELLCLVERVCWRARKRCVKARTIVLKLRYSDFTTVMRSRTVSPTADETVVLRAVSELLYQHRTRRVSSAAHSSALGIRLLGVGLANLLGEEAELQLPLPLGRARHVGPLIDRVRSKYGYDSVHFAGAAATPAARGLHARLKR